MKTYLDPLFGRAIVLDKADRRQTTHTLYIHTHTQLMYDMPLAPWTSRDQCQNQPIKGVPATAHTLYIHTHTQLMYDMPLAPWTSRDQCQNQPIKGVPATAMIKKRFMSLYFRCGSSSPSPYCRRRRRGFVHCVLHNSCVVCVVTPVQSNSLEDWIRAACGITPPPPLGGSHASVGNRTCLAAVQVQVCSVAAAQGHPAGLDRYHSRLVCVRGEVQLGSSNEKPDSAHPTEIRTSISPSSAVQSTARVAEKHLKIVFTLHLGQKYLVKNTRYQDVTKSVAKTRLLALIAPLGTRTKISNLSCVTLQLCEVGARIPAECTEQSVHRKVHEVLPRKHAPPGRRTTYWLPCSSLPPIYPHAPCVSV
uniref:Uncharacterized protein n=1 Tax=Timema genevievae TaxID=629358 RepID=A0A7R9PL43_TIMGE|nr:unnamed protein product [Timema genevievae]